MRLTVFFIKFVFLAAFFIISNQNLALVDADNREIFVEEYKAWVFTVTEHVGSLTSYVVKVEWLPQTVERVDEAEEKDKPRYSQVKR